MVKDTTEQSSQCATCAYFHSVRLDPARNVNVGECGLGHWPKVRPETSTCRDHVVSGSLAKQPPSKSSSGKIHRSSPAKIIRPPIEIEVDMDESTFRTVLREILQEELSLSDTPIGERWKGGLLVLKPGKEGTKEHSVPLENFFNKIVMIRDRLRVLEQKN